MVYSHYVLFRGPSSTVQSRPEFNSQYRIKKKILGVKSLVAEQLPNVPKVLSPISNVKKLFQEISEKAPCES